MPSHPLNLERCQAFFVSIHLYNAAIATVKFAFLAQYYRIMTVRSMRVAVLVVTAIVGAWSLSQMVITLVTCAPISGFWDRTPDSVCLPELPICESTPSCLTLRCFSLILTLYRVYKRHR